MGKQIPDDSAGETPQTTVALTIQQEKTLLRPTGSRRHAVFTVAASLDEAAQAARAAANEQRRPLTLALTLDRSGSMSGKPLEMAKQVANALVDGMDERDEIAVVIFDDKIETLQELAPVTPTIKSHIRRALAQVQARGSTALHEAWLTSCQMLTSDHLPETRLARCYLLTDGQANVGETDVETIATQAAGVREHTGVGTSAFGLGDDYNELLLGPWATAGGGQFHDLRDLSDLSRAFMGERDDLRAVVALRTRLELELSAGMTAEVISAYWRAGDTTSAEHWLFDIGDLLGGEQRRVVVRFGFPKEDKAYSYTVRAHVIWIADHGEQSSPWQEISFHYGSQEECSAEPRGADTMRTIGLAHADRTQRQALEYAAAGDSARALRHIQRAIARIGVYAGDDPELREAIRGLVALAETIEARKLTSRASKEAYYAQQTRSRGQKDYRSGQP